MVINWRKQMANSGIPWIDTTFDWAVIALVECAKFMGITYEEINVWLFCVAWPASTIALIFWSLSLWRQNRSLRRQTHAI
jgi:hypothetical protein